MAGNKGLLDSIQEFNQLSDEEQDARWLKFQEERERENTPVPPEEIKEEGVCPICGAPIRVTCRRRYDEATQAVADSYDSSGDPDRYGFNYDEYERSHPPFTVGNSVLYVADRICGNSECANVHFPDPPESPPVRWVRTDRQCSACHGNIIEEWNHTESPPQRIHYSCEKCRLIFAGLPAK